MFINDKEFEAELLKWAEKTEEKGLNIVTFPGRGITPLSPVIRSFLEKGKDVLLITAGDVKKETEEFSAFSGKFKVMSYDEAMKERNTYGLIIYDDVNSVPLRDSIEMKSLAGVLLSLCDKFIGMSSVKFFKEVSTFYLAPYERGQFITEPRLISTRLDISQFLPTALFDFLTYFIKDRRKVMIISTSEESCDSVIDYLGRINSDFKNICLKSSQYESEVLSEYLTKKDEAVFVFTENIDEPDRITGDFDYVVLDAGSSVYFPGQFIHLCSRASLRSGTDGEVLLVSAEVSESMFEAKDMSREFNRMLWESGHFSGE